MFLILLNSNNLIYAEVMKLVDVLDSKSCVGNHVPVRVRPSIYAEVMKLVDVLDSKSCVGNHVPVRVRPSAFFY